MKRGIIIYPTIYYLFVGVISIRGEISSLSSSSNVSNYFSTITAATKNETVRKIVDVVDSEDVIFANETEEKKESGGVVKEAETFGEENEDPNDDDDDVVCEIPPSIDRFFYLSIFTDQCYAYAGSGPEWSAMTGFGVFDQDNYISSSSMPAAGGSSSSPKRRITNISSTNSSSSKTPQQQQIYSCGNGKKLPPFAPIVHILNASWFLEASTTTTTATNSAEKKKSKQENGGGGGGNETNNTAIGENGERNNTNTTANKSSTTTAPNPDEDWCMLVNFYSPGCPFSAKLAPFYNALPRAFPKLLYIAAVDATQSSRLNLIYGVAGTPTVMLFHNGKPVARLDEAGEFALQRLAMFVSQRTDLKPLFNVDVENEDLNGPLPAVPVRGFDYYSLLAWAFILACSAYYGAQSSSARRLWETLCRNWREMEEEEGRNE